jgi:hypothetical protein
MYTAKKMWMEMLENKNMGRCALSPVNAKDRSVWRGRIYGAKRPTQLNLDQWRSQDFEPGGHPPVSSSSPSPYLPSLPRSPSSPFPSPSLSLGVWGQLGFRGYHPGKNLQISYAILCILDNYPKNFQTLKLPFFCELTHCEIIVLVDVCSIKLHNFCLQLQLVQ